MNANRSRYFDPARVAKKLQKRNSRRLLATVHEFNVLAEGQVGQVIVGLSSPTSDRKAIQAAINNAFDGKAVIVPDSFRQLVNIRGNRPILSGFVVPNRVVEPYTDERVKDMRVMASNILMDAKDQSLWNVKTSGGQKFLCRDQDEDLSELLAHARTRRVGVPQIQEIARIASPERSYVGFVDPAEGIVKFGYVLTSCTDSGDVLIAVRDEEAVATHPALIVEVASLGDSEPKMQVTAKARPTYIPEEKLKAWAKKQEVADEIKPITVEDPEDLTETDLKQYYADLYQQDPSYYSNLEQLMRTHGVV